MPMQYTVIFTIVKMLDLQLLIFAQTIEYRYIDAVLRSTHNIHVWLRAKISKNVYLCNTQFCYIRESSNK